MNAVVSCPLDKMPHAVLLSGGTYEKKWEITSEWISQLLPTQKFTPPDILILPVVPQTVLYIDDIREAIAHLQKTSHQGGNKIVVLTQIDSMPLGASQALLKILEEPPAGSYLFLFSNYVHLLPLTLRSRCHKMRLPAQPKISVQLVNELKLTLIKLSQHKITVFEAAEKWLKVPLIETLDGLFYCLLQQKKYQAGDFYWYDLLNTIRRKVFNKNNPNHLLALESLFYHWMQGQLLYDNAG